MSTEIGKIKNSGPRMVDMSVTRFYGGDKVGICVQLSAKMEEGDYGYVQLSVSDIFALLPKLKEYIIDEEMNRKKNEIDSAISDNKDLKNTIFSDMSAVARMMIDVPIMEVANILFYNSKSFELSDEILEQNKIDTLNNKEK